MLSKEIIQQIKQIQLKAGHLVTEALSGEYSSAFKGLGMEFDKVREYTAGDDVRTIDWNVTARMNQPFVKVFREERELTIMLLVDVSGSLQFGTTKRMKNELAAELAAVLAFLATKNNDKVGLILFTDHVEQYIPPQKGRSHVWRIIREVLTFEGQKKSTNISSALDFLMQVTKRRCSCFLLSDFCTSGYEQSLKFASKRHDLTCISFLDKGETALSDCGIVELFDAESQENITVNTSSQSIRDHFSQFYKNSTDARQNLFFRLGLDHFSVSTTDSVVTPLLKYIRRRERIKP